MKAAMKAQVKGHMYNIGWDTKGRTDGKAKYLQIAGRFFSSVSGPYYT
jgi:hypothetical protein